MNRILFVDDERQVLDGLRDALRRKRKVWDMRFAEGGVAALEQLGISPADVVVTDMRMPGMDGAALLQAVRERHPGTTRIVLSGHAERDQLTRAMAIAHQYLAKPCDGPVLSATLERVLEARDRIADPRVHTLIGRLAVLPAAHETHRQFSAALADGMAGLDAIADILERDPCIAARLLQLANSAFFGLSRPLASIRDAIGFLGTDQVRALVMTAALFDAVAMSRDIPGFDPERWQQHSLVVARVARALVEHPAQRDEAFSAGLLHDIGIFVLALAAPEAMARLLEAARARGTSIPEAEVCETGITHAAIGGGIAAAWGLPASVALAIATHHDGETTVTGPALSTAAAVRVANRLVGSVQSDGTAPADENVHASIPPDRRDEVLKVLSASGLRLATAENSHDH